jgi:nuclear transcription factor Y, alpha
VRDDDEDRDDAIDSPRDMPVDPVPSPVSSNPRRPVVSQPPAQSQPPTPVPTLAPAPPPHHQQQQPVTQFQAGHRANPVNVVNMSYHQIQSQQSQPSSSPALYQDMRVHPHPHSHPQASTPATAQPTHSHAGLRGFHPASQSAPAVPPPAPTSAPPLPSQMAAVHTAASPAPGVLRSPFSVMQMHHVPHPHAHARHHNTRLNIAEGLYGPDGGSQSGRT